jgi:hypothetical protein
LPYEALLCELFGDTTAQGLYANSIQSLVDNIDPALTTPAIRQRETHSTDATSSDADVSLKRAFEDLPTLAKRTRKKRDGQQLFSAALNRLADSMDRGVIQQAKGPESKVQQAVQILMNEYEELDEDWIFEAIEILNNEQNAAIFIALKQGTIRDNLQDLAD